MRLIDADALEEIFRKTYKVDDKGVICAVIDEAPTVEAEPVRHGEWLPKCADVPSICSVCGEDWDEFTYGQDKWYTGGLPKYCPHCGAKME